MVKIKTIGGTRDIYLNPETDKCEKIYDSGTCTFFFRFYVLNIYFKK